MRWQTQGCLAFAFLQIESKQMKRIALLLLLSGLLMSFGCNSESATDITNKGQPITVEAWQKLDIAKKYQLDTLERLRLTYPKLAQEKDWDRFMREVVVPDRRNDIPTEY